MKETKSPIAAPIPKFAPGNKVYLLDKVKNKYVFTPELIVGVETLSLNPQNPALTRIVYVLDGKPFGSVCAEMKLFTEEEVQRLVKEEPKLYSIENERPRK